MTILVDANINTKCKHKICALRILIITLLECVEDHEISDNADIATKIDVNERNDNIITIEFIQ